MRRNQDRRAGRPAFTLIELIVVIGILAVLAALLLSGVMAWRAGAMRASTRTLLERLQEQLDKQVSHAQYMAGREAIPQPVKDLAGGDTERAKVIWIKIKLKQAFPNNFAEALDPAPGYGIGPLAGYRRHLQAHGIIAGNATTQPHESAACLLMALRYGPEATAEDRLGFGTSVKTISGVPCLVDVFGTPLVFCRWPWGSPEVQAKVAGKSVRERDPYDPRATLMNPSWQGSFATRFEALVGHPVRSGSPATPTSFNLPPVIISAGANGRPGVDLNSLAPLGGDANDNVYPSQFVK